MCVLLVEYKEYICFFMDVVELDICDEQVVMIFVKENNIYVIVNCVVYMVVDKVEDDIELCIKLNKNVVSYLVKVVEVNWGEFIQILMDYVFDGMKYFFYNEGDVFCFNFVYGKIKLVGEMNVLEYCKKIMIICIVWFYFIFGNNFVKMMFCLGKEKEILGVVFDQIGILIYVCDLVCVIFIVIYKGVVLGVYYFSDEGVCFWYDFIKVIYCIVGIMICKVSFLYINEYLVKVFCFYYFVLDKIKIKIIYNIEIFYWEESLEVCIKELNV